MRQQWGGTGNIEQQPGGAVAGPILLRTMAALISMTFVCIQRLGTTPCSCGCAHFSRMGRKASASAESIKFNAVLSILKFLVPELLPAMRARSS